MKKMKKIFIYTIISLILGACHSFDIEPKNIIQNDIALGTEEGVTAYFANIYWNIPIEDFTYRTNNNKASGLHGDWTNFSVLGCLTGELLGTAEFRLGNTTVGSNYWPYDRIRDINSFLEAMPNFASNYDKAKVDMWMGEAYFCRAYYYFGLVKRYGGVPIIKTVQKYPEQTIEELKVPRDKEEAVYDFISEDLDMAISLLGTTNEKSRATKYAAAALKSRIMLHAASLAKYNVPDMSDEATQKGFVGIPASRAADYFDQSYKAAEIVEQGDFKLYEANTDLVQNYVDLFLDEGSSENIFVRQYIYGSGQNYTHSYDRAVCPGLSGTGGALGITPTFNFLELFGPLPINEADGVTPRRFTNRADLAQTPGIEARVKAIAYFPGEVVPGWGELDVRRGLYKTYPPTESADRIVAGSYTSKHTYNGKEYQVMGMNGMGARDLTYSGFHLRKYQNYKMAPELAVIFRSTQSWIDIRLSEILLNKAEVAYELGRPSEAMALVNQIRARVGATPYTTATFNLDELRLERRRELAFENRTFWDFIRWRTFDVEILNFINYAICPYYVLDEDKYIFLKEEEENRTSYTFTTKQYYEGLPSAELARNPNLYPNNPQY